MDRKKAKGISTDNATAEDAQATTGNAKTGKEKGTSRGSGKGKGKEVLGVGDNAKGKKSSEVKENTKGEKPIVSFRLFGKTILDPPVLEIVTSDSEDVGDTPKTRDEIADGKKGIDGSEAATEKVIGDSWDSDRVLRSQSATTSGDKGKGKESVIVGDKAKGKAKEEKPIVSFRSFRKSQRGESTARMHAPKVGKNNDEVKAVTSTSAKIQQGGAVVKYEERQNGNAEDGEERGKSEKRGREEKMAVRRDCPTKSRYDPRNKK